MNLSDFDYNLPRELIAQYPTEKRDGSRLLVMHRDTAKIEHRIFKDIVEYFHKGDLLVLNNTKVVPARLFGRKETGGKVEALVLYRGKGCPSTSVGTGRVKDEYEVLLKPARGCKLDSKLIFGDGELEAVVAKIKDGRRFLKFKCNGNFEEILNRLGKMPLPPYIKRDVLDSDKERYQTVFASKEGAVAAPTAGLHFTEEILADISKRGIDIDYITLHIGYGTFKSVKCEDIARHKMEKEYFEIDKGLIEKLKNKKGRVITVGTTTCRVLETIFSNSNPSKNRDSDHFLFKKNGCCPYFSGWTDLFIYPPYKFKSVNALLTNFHLPRTTLLMLVSTFCGRELLFKTYQEAIKRKYRFYSYGDAMLII